MLCKTGAIVSSKMVGKTGAIVSTKMMGKTAAMISDGYHTLFKDVV